MITVLLYGKLAKEFGKAFKFDVQTKAEAINAMMCAVKGFKLYMSDEKEYMVSTNYDDSPLDHYGRKLKDGDIVRIIPMIVGGGGIFRIVAGIALMAFAPYAGVVGMGGAFGMTSSALVGKMMSMGFSMILGGITDLLFAPPEPEEAGSYEYQAAENKPSYAFSGSVNTSKQGNPVPVGYGQLRVGSQVISAGMYAENTPI